MNTPPKGMKEAQYCAQSAAELDQRLAEERAATYAFLVNTQQSRDVIGRVRTTDPDTHPADWEYDEQVPQWYIAGTGVYVAEKYLVQNHAIYIPDPELIDPEKVIAALQKLRGA